MSLRLKIPCNETKKEIGIFNHIKALYIPLGISLQVSFKETPKDDELYPLTDTVSDLDANGDMVENARRCFLHISGTSTEDIDIIASNVIPGGGYVHVDQMNTFALEPTTKNVLEDLTLAQLDKIINPYYNNPNITTYSASANTSLTKILSKTLSCDKIIINLNWHDNVNWHISANKGVLKAEIDGNVVCASGAYITTYSQASEINSSITMENVNGKLLEISNIFDSTDRYVSFVIQEYTLK